MRILFQNSSSIFTFRPSVLKRDMSIYTNIYTDFEHWFQYISCSHDQTRPDQTSGYDNYDYDDDCDDYDNYKDY